MKKEKFYIFIDLSSSNECLWDREDSIEEYGSTTSSENYVIEHKANVGKDSVKGLNILIDHARENLDLEPVIVLAYPRTSKARLPVVMMQNLKKKGLNDCQIEDWNYVSKGDGSFARALAMKMYHEETGKKEGFSDKFHYNYAKKAKNICVLVTSDNAYSKAQLGGLSYHFYLNDREQVILLGGEHGALNEEMAHVFVANNCAYNMVYNKLLAKEIENEIEIEHAQAIAELENLPQTSREDPNCVIAEALAEAEEIERGE
ncbi:MAG: hypothetical protein IJ542_00505 [Clostridia bacterium]|nr:hypothetical protein [Clostridia bacterium]